MQPLESWLKTDTLDAFTLTLTTDRVINRSERFIPGPGRENWEVLAVKSDDDIAGHWSMIYDLGFQVEATTPAFDSPVSMVAYLEYHPRHSEECKPKNSDHVEADGTVSCYKTLPHRTMVGWYEVLGKGQYGCFRAATNDRKQERLVSMGSFSMGRPSTDNYFLGPNFAVHSSSAKARRKVVSRASSRGCEGRNKRGDQILPSIWSWGDPITFGALDLEFKETHPVLDQSTCGSCFDIAITYTLQKRAEIAQHCRSDPKSPICPSQLRSLLTEHDKKTLNAALQSVADMSRSRLLGDVQLSARSLIDCDIYNQGCEGGYPYLAGRHARQTGIATEDCVEYTASRSYSCPFNIFSNTAARKECSNDQRVYALRSGYVGGCFECTTEDLIMKELLLNGPLVLAVDVPPGLITSPLQPSRQHSPLGHQKVCDVYDSSLTGWEFTAHALSLVGWTDEAWVVRNSWGAPWGLDGYGLLRRGFDTGGSENQVVFVDVDMSRGLLKL